MHQIIEFLVGLWLGTFVCLLSGHGQTTTTDFVGEWAFELPDGNPAWLQIQQREGDLAGSLLWSVGSARPVSELTINEGQLLFKRRVRWQPYGEPDELREITEPFTGRLVDGRLQLTFTQVAVHSASGELEELVLVGKRLPPLPSKPDLKKVRYGESILLFNGRDLDGWKLSDPRKRNGWRAAGGELINETPKRDFGAYGAYGNLITEKVFSDFRLSLEYNVPFGGNSGVYLRGMYEAQIVDRDSRMQGINGPGSIFGRLKPSKNAANPGGEWNSLVLILVDRHVTVELNGEIVIDNQPLIGCTGGGLSADVTQPGPIFLQGDHTSVRYRRIVLEPVESVGED